MKRTFVTYGDEGYRESLARIGREAEATGAFDEVRLYTPADLPEPFASYTRTYRRGGGYWLWKPFVIASELDRAAEGDIVAYADAGCTLFPHRDWERYFRAVAGREELFFLAPGKSRRWCKREVFDFFAPAGDAWKHASQVQATFIIARKSGGNEVLRRWLARRGFALTGETLCQAAGRWYAVMNARYAAAEHEPDGLECLCGKTEGQPGFAAYCAQQNVKLKKLIHL